MFLRLLWPAQRSPSPDHEKSENGSFSDLCASNAIWFAKHFLAAGKAVAFSALELGAFRELFAVALFAAFSFFGVFAKRGHGAQCLVD